MRVYDIVRRTFFGVPGIYFPHYQTALSEEEEQAAVVFISEVRERAKHDRVLQLRLQLNHHYPSTLTVASVLKQTRNITAAATALGEKVIYSSSITNPNVCVQSTESAVARYLLGELFFDKHIRSRRKKGLSTADDEKSKLKYFIPYLNLVIDDKILAVRKCTSEFNYGKHALGVFLNSKIPATGCVLHQLTGQHVQINKQQYDNMVSKKLDVSIVELVTHIPSNKKNHSIYKILIGPLSLVNHKCYNHSNVFAGQWGTGDKSQQMVDNWLVCTTQGTASHKSIAASTEISLHYGADYAKILQCSVCPAPAPTPVAGSNSRRKRKHTEL
jgi:hypothetical protein